jgi:alkyldihydroxyacetonephosphate synthase
MRRWNGWGDESVSYPVPSATIPYLEKLVGVGHPAQDVALKDILASVPKSRLPRHPQISTEGKDSLLHARGQSFPDWMALRSGQIN